MFRESQPLLLEYIASVAVDAPVDSDKPRRFLRSGAVIANLVYFESGYTSAVREAGMTLGILDAEYEGIPEAFIMSLPNDPKLVSLMDIIPSRPEISDLAEDNTYEQLLNLGAGCVRHFITSDALAA